MSEIIENWSDLSGKLLEVRAHPTQPAMSLVRVAVEKVGRVPGFAHLLGATQGTEVQIAVKNETLKHSGASVDSDVWVHARLARPGIVIAHPDHFGSP